MKTNIKNKPEEERWLGLKYSKKHNLLFNRYFTVIIDSFDITINAKQYGMTYSMSDSSANIKMKVDGSRFELGELGKGFGQLYYDSEDDYDADDVCKLLTCKFCLGFCKQDCFLCTKCETVCKCNQEKWKMKPTPFEIPVQYGYWSKECDEPRYIFKPYVLEAIADALLRETYMDYIYDDKYRFFESEDIKEWIDNVAYVARRSFEHLPHMKYVHVWNKLMMDKWNT